MVVQGGCCLARGLRAGKSSADRIGRILSTPSKIDIFDVDRIGEAQSSMKRDMVRMAEKFRYMKGLSQIHTLTLFRPQR